MAYVFDNNAVATLRFDPVDGEKLNVNNISGSETSADVIIRGVQCLLWIGGRETDFNPLAAYRTVKQNVDNDE